VRPLLPDRDGSLKEAPKQCPVQKKKLEAVKVSIRPENILANI
jgi:hypothetical protein